MSNYHKLSTLIQDIQQLQNNTKITSWFKCEWIGLPIDSITAPKLLHDAMITSLPQLEDLVPYVFATSHSQTQVLL